MRGTLMAMAAAFAALILAGGSCVTGGGNGTTPGESSGTPLILEGDEVGDWMTIGNTFSVRGPWQSAHTDSVFYRSGILFQFADYDTAAKYQFGAIVVYSGGAEKKFERSALTDSTAFFVNIVADWDKHPADPMLGEEAFALYPNDNPYSCPPSVPDLDPRCLRGRTLHENMNRVLAVLTYWQGPQGWAATSAPRQGRSSNSNTTRFTFPDAFRVEVYRSEGDRGSQVMALVQTFATGTVDSVKVTLSTVPPNRGEMADPPWLWP